MAGTPKLLPRKEFAEMCGLDVKKLNVYIQRKKVVCDSNDKSFIDANNPINKAFKVKQISSQTRKENTKKPVVAKREAPTAKHETPSNSKQKFDEAMDLLRYESDEEEPEIKPKKHSGPKTLKERLRDTSNPDNKVDMEFAAAMRQIELDNKKEEQALELQSLKIQLEKIKIEKLSGNLIPVDLVRGVLKRYADAIFKTFDKGIEQIIEVAVGGNPEKRVRYTGNAKKVLAQCILDASDKAKQDIAVLVNEFSESRERGEKA